MKKVIALILALAMCFCLFAGCGDSNEPASTPAAPSTSTPAAPSTDDTEAPADGEYEWPVMTLTINDYNVEGSGPAMATKAAAAHIEEVSGGNITCDLYFNGTLMESTDSFAGTAEGMADITYYLFTLNSGVCDVNTLFTLYYSREMPDMQGMYEVINQVLAEVPEFQQEWEKQNLHMLATVPTAGSRMQFNDADLAASIKTPADLEGKLIQSSGYNTKAWADYGVSGMSMAPSEWYSNLERGVVDALTMNMPGCEDFGLVDVTNGYVNFGESGGLYCSAGGYLANLDAWNSWDPEVQQLITEAYIIGGQVNVDRDNEGQNRILAEEEAAGKLINRIAQEDMQPWYDLGMQAVEYWKEAVTAAGYDADSIYDRYSAIIDEYLAAN